LVNDQLENVLRFLVGPLSGATDVVSVVAAW